MRNIAHNLKRNALYHHNVKTMTLYRNPDYSTWCGDRATVRANLTDRYTNAAQLKYSKIAR